MPQAVTGGIIDDVTTNAALLSRLRAPGSVDRNEPVGCKAEQSQDWNWRQVDAAIRPWSPSHDCLLLSDSIKGGGRCMQYARRLR